ncbi:MAG: hypothetical protein JST25_05210 [Actinobacteria bacterium]|nr:hypothetical protein [Actinomycetota bacterium]
MDLHPSMSYRISTLEIEQAAIRAERARRAAEHADQIVRRDGILGRLRNRLQMRRVASAPAAAETAAAPAFVAPAAAAPAAVAPAAAPSARGFEAAPSADPAHDRELVGCAPHAA